MSDPVVEAAHRAWKSNAARSHREFAILTAREALAPLRELHKPTDSDEWHTSPDVRYCGTCREADRPTMWPCDTARLIYPSEEL